MFAKLFNKSSPQAASHPRARVRQADLDPRVTVHYGIPSPASILALDRTQSLLAIGTLDGRIKVIGGDNIQELLTSPKPLPFKNLEKQLECHCLIIFLLLEFSINLTLWETDMRIEFENRLQKESIDIPMQLLSRRTTLPLQYSVRGSGNIKLVYLLFVHLDMKGTSSWKEDFRQMIQRDVEVRDTVLGVEYFSDVYNLEGPQYYEENAPGAFLYSANAISDVNGYIWKAFKPNMTDEEKGKKLMAVEQIFDMLISFFPHMLIDVYDFLVKKGLPIDVVL